jgi:hypothetical protein
MAPTAAESWREDVIAAAAKRRELTAATIGSCSGGREGSRRLRL